MEWIKLSDKEPQEGKDVLISDGDCILIAELDNNSEYGKGWKEDGHHWEFDEFTHWQELPELPIIKTNKQ